MDTYGFLRMVADSWALLALTLVFLGAILWVFRPAGRVLQDEAARMIFRNDDAPGQAAGQARKEA